MPGSPNGDGDQEMNEGSTQVNLRSFLEAEANCYVVDSSMSTSSVVVSDGKDLNLTKPLCAPNPTIATVGLSSNEETKKPYAGSELKWSLPMSPSRFSITPPQAVPEDMGARHAAYEQLNLKKPANRLTRMEFEHMSRNQSKCL